VLFFFCGIVAHAQTGIVLTGHDAGRGELNETELLAISAVKRPSCVMPTKTLTLDLSGVIWDGERDSLGNQILRDTAWRETQSWQYFGQSFIANMMFNPKVYRTEEGLDSAVCVGYVLCFANINEEFSNAYGNKNSVTHKTIKTILKDKSYHEGIYQWLKPAFVSVWKTFGEDVRDFFRGVIAYVKTFNYDTEKKYYEKLKTEDRMGKFTCYEPNGKYDARRKAKAWIFRRIYFDGWDFSYVLKWTNRIEKEIMV
jgi:hypothetical protein